MGSLEPIAAVSDLEAAFRLEELKAACAEQADARLDAAGTVRLLDCCYELLTQSGRDAVLAGFVGMVQSIEWLRANVDLVRRSRRPLRSEQMGALSAWPAAVAGYLRTPDTDAIDAVIGVVADPAWALRPSDVTLGSLRVALSRDWLKAPGAPQLHGSEPATAVAAEAALVPIAPGHGSAADPQMPAVDETAAATLEGAIEEFTAAAAAGVRRADDRLRYKAALLGVMAQAETAQRVDLLDVCGRVLENVELLNSHPSESDASALPMLDFPIALSSYVSAPASAEGATMLLACLSDAGWSLPLGADERPLLGELLGLRDGCAGPTGAAGAAAPDPALPELSVGLQQCDPDQLALLATEFTAFANTLAGELESTDPSAAPAIRGRVIESCAELLQRFAGASQAIGLIALNWILTVVAGQVAHMSQSGIGPERRHLLRDWARCVRGYLGAPTDPSAGSALAEAMTAASWPTPVGADMAVDLEAALIAVDLVRSASGEPRPIEASEEDVSLTIPEDVGAELIEGLLSELPLQSAEFAAAIQRIGNGAGSLYDLEAAKRAAHTLKGAANTVGVKGIANLTHHLEDILIALTRFGTLPTRELALLFSTASDCLESMSEAVLGVCAAPSDARQVLQQVLDWANRLDREGVDALATASELTPPAMHLPARPEVEPSGTSEAAVAPGPTLRLSTAIVDELLRLVGETMIANTQIKEQLRLAIEHTRAVTSQSQALQQLANDLETLVDIRGIAVPLKSRQARADFDALEFDRYNELHTLSRRLVEAATDSRELSVASEDRLAAFADLLETQARLQLGNQNVVMKMRMVSVGTIASRLQRSVRQTARLLDKRVDLQVHGAATAIDSNILNEIVDPLMHALRNAVDHGIESPEVRLAAGKPAGGRIDLSFAREGASIVIRCADDGAGLDYAAIRSRARENGLLDPNATFSNDDLARLILLPGFSTRDEASQVSGRGIGMDVINQRVHSLKGSLRLTSRPGQGLALEMRLPASLTTLHGLLVRVGDQTMVVSAYGVLDIHYVTRAQLRKVSTGTVYLSGGQAYPLDRVESLLQVCAAEDERDWWPALLVSSERGVRAVAVPEILDSQEIVLKDVGPYVEKPAGLLGVTVLGNGAIAPVIDLPQLLQGDAPGLRVTGNAQPAPRRSSPIEGRRSALIVDDSLSARRAAAQLMRDAGFEVRTAIDGIEAAAMIEKKVPDIVLVDMEMPRLNGLDLTIHLRSREASRSTPVVMITSRSTEKHRKEAEKAGVDVYLTKPFNDDELLQHVERLTSQTLVR
jgi:chemosensory pili system protein ChpA (sensor histidine kinase/response regulator)